MWVFLGAEKAITVACFYVKKKRYYLCIWRSDRILKKLKRFVCLAFGVLVVYSSRVKEICNQKYLPVCIDGI